MSGPAGDPHSHEDLPRVGPKAAEDEMPSGMATRGLTLRTMLPNAITAAALCSGLTGIRFAVTGDWHFAILAVIIAGVLDGIDGRIARLLRAQSRFGAELDSLADNVSFGVAPALILYMWALQDLPRIGWFAALAFAVCMALRLARFNAQIDVDEQPHKSAGFLTGVPAPVGAGLVFLPVYLWLETGLIEFRNPVYLAIWVAAIAFLLISNLATLSWSSIRPRRNVRLEFLALAGIMFGGGMLMEPWWTLIVICVGYLALVPFGLIKYGKIKRQRREAAEG